MSEKTQTSTLKKLTHDDYTIGWVCALEKEQTAAIAMLEERHETLPRSRIDNNTYTLGSIGDHNIVIACRLNEDGPVTALAVSMISTFQSIRFGLMVGIGSGIPPKVRVGDVVVGQPVKDYTGVVQWDVGKMQIGGFERIGISNGPPRSLLTAVNRLKTEHEMNGSRINEYLDQMAKRYPQLASKYTRCDSLRDSMLDTGNQERENVCFMVWQGFVAFLWYLLGLLAVLPTKVPATADNQGATTDNGEETRKDVQIHYGLIASGNTKIKDAKIRDSLDRSLGGNLLCVETKAVDITNQFPCIVVRGICDYADATDNDEWQEYAASVAAAFTKELLGYVQPSDIDTDNPVKVILDEVRETVSKARKDIKDVKSNISKKEKVRLLNWLTPVEYGSQHTDYIRRRQPSTGKWLLESPEYQEWLTSSNKTFFCPGIPGAGKTILAAIVVDSLLHRFRNDSSIGVAYMYLDFQEQQAQTVHALLLSVAKQLIRQSPSIPEEIRDLYRYRHFNGTAPSPDEIFIINRLACNKLYSRVFLVIDALDECNPFVRSNFLSEIFELQSHGDIRLFATSRFFNDIANQFGNIKLEIRASDDDVKKYIDGNMSTLPSCVMRNKPLQDTIKKVLVKSVDGMFLLAQLYLSSFRDKVTERAVLDVLEQIQQLNPGSDYSNEHRVLSLAYDGAISRIENQSLGLSDLAQNVLIWMTHAKRPLTTTELQHALSVKPSTSTLDEKNIPDPNDMISVCAGLVMVDEKSRIIRLAHNTTKQYIEYVLKREWLSNAESVIARTCMTYISFDTFENPSHGGNTVSSFPFLQYAVDYTLSHISNVVKSSKRVHTLFRIDDWFLARLAKLTDWVYHNNSHGANDSNMIGGNCGSLFRPVCAQGDLDIVKRSLNHEADVNLRVSIYGTPFNVATILNRWEVFELLLRDARAGFGNIALQFSSYGEPFRIVNIQQKRKTDANATEAFVDILYDNGVDVDATEGFQAAVRRELFMVSPSKTRRTISMEEDP